MRPVARSLRAQAAALRTRPRPRWWKPLQRVLPFAAAVLLLVSLARAALQAGYGDTLATGMEGVRAAIARLAGLRVEAVRSRGLERTDRGAVRAILAPLVGRYILAVDLVSVQNRLEALPWVASARVRRLLPNTLLVEIRERQPAAVWSGPDGIRLLDDQGQIVPTAEAARFRRLPLLHGREAPARLPDLLRLFDHAPELAPRLTAAALVGGRRWDLFFDGRVRLRLPEEEVEQAWRRFLEAERRDGLLERAVDTIDLRSPDWLVLRLREELVTSIRGERA